MTTYRKLIKTYHICVTTHRYSDSDTRLAIVGCHSRQHYFGWLWWTELTK